MSIEDCLHRHKSVKSRMGRHLFARRSLCALPASNLIAHPIYSRDTQVESRVRDEVADILIIKEME